MSLKINIYNKINIGFSLLIVFLLVFATNRIDKMHFETVQNALTTVYEDRVIAQDYIYKMSTMMYEKQLLSSNSNFTDVNQKLNKEIQTLINIYCTTKLTPIESKTFKRLEANFNTFKLKEKTSTKEDIQSRLGLLLDDLNNLAEIQVSESKYMTDVAQKSLDNNKFISQLEIGFLILVGLLIQFIIFYRIKKTKNE